MNENRILRRDLEYSLRDKDLEINEKIVKKKKKKSLMFDQANLVTDQVPRICMEHLRWDERAAFCLMLWGHTQHKQWDFEGFG